MCICVSLCVCVCVCLTQLSYKRITCPFLWLETGSFSETGKRLIIIVYEWLRGPSMVLLFSPVFTLKGVCCCCGEIWSKRTRVFEDDVFIENMRLVGGSKTQDLNLRADVVLSMSRGPPGQWFPETEYWASAVFVGTSGIPPKIIYRSVKSYPIKRRFKISSLTLSLNKCRTGKFDGPHEKSLVDVATSFSYFMSHFELIQ